MLLKDKIAIVTGASQGIGQIIAMRMAAEGARTVLVARNELNLQRTARHIVQEGGSSLVVPTDITDSEQIAQLIERTMTEYGPADILVNNSGISGPTKRLEDLSREEWDECFAVNMTGVFMMTRAVIPLMKERRSGRIINIGSITGKRPLVGRTPYAASKMALIGFTRTLAFEVGEFGVTANTICPGYTEGARVTRFCEDLAHTEEITYEEAAATFTEPAALKRFVHAKDHAAMCVFLASEEGANITGQDINVSGGLTWY